MDIEQHNAMKFNFEVISGMAERTIKRLWILAILLTVFLVGTNVAWILYEAQFEEVRTVEVEQDTGSGNGANYFVGGDFLGQAED